MAILTGEFWLDRKLIIHIWWANTWIRDFMKPPGSEKGNSNIMGSNENFLFIGSAALAVVGTIGYHNFIKMIPATIDPIISVIAIYVFVMIISALIFPFFVDRSAIADNIRMVNWTQFGVACAVVCMELGFLLMYRSGWDLSVGNVVTGVAINIVLLGIGFLLFKEALSPINVLGVLLSIVGVALISYRVA
ncbi:EamA family transporter [Roseibium sediminicola]|uniref:EamA-like transporter family protein n=1 Tax=Roseibium sediminicola TaxID=2933272 RepID=A0ABT0GZU0_9HYPH|nr:EamA family transporter [Roseibium sp. CAU 1639]MCK7614947.1 hypothetical protein [Roseibium sp. CAU 1639]